VIPREIRERLRLRPGQQVTLFERDGIITAIPDAPLEKFRGILKGMSPAELREKQDRI
jgi:AbrB family looped-hinge helix DNA binding protein